jgi:6-phosphogluconolactonase (cycloisomerase 2 family)
MTSPFLYQPVGSAPAPVTIVNIKTNSASCSKLGLCLLFGFIALAGVVVFLGITGDLPGFPNGVDPDVPPPPPPLPSQYNHTVGPLLPLDPFVFSTPSLVPDLFAISPGGQWLYSLNTATGTISTYVSNFITGQLSLLNSVAYVSNVSTPSLMYISEGGDFLYLGFTASPAFEVIEIDLYTGDLVGLATVQLSTSAVVAIYDDPAVIYTFVSDSIGNIVIIFMVEYYSPLLVNTTNTGNKVTSMVCDSTSTWLYTLDNTYRIKQWLIANDSAPLQLINSTKLFGPTLFYGWTQLQAQGGSLYVMNENYNTNSIFVYAVDPSSGVLSMEGTLPPLASYGLLYLTTDLFLYALGTAGEQVIISQFALNDGGSTSSELAPASFVATTLVTGNSQSFFLLSAGSAQGVVYICVGGNQSILQFVIE